jgi:hypothetical protein
MDKERFINWELFAKLLIHTGVICFVFLGVKFYFFDDEFVVGLFSFGAAYGMILTHHVYELHNKLDTLGEGIVALMGAIPILGKASDNILRQSVDINRFMMHKLLTEEEKSKLIEMTYERHGEEAAEGLARWLFDGPVEAMQRNMDDETQTTELDDLNLN